MESNYKYKINTEVKVESRKSYIKHLRAMTLYMEEEVTDDDFQLMVLGIKPFPNIDTFRILGVEEL